MQTESLALLLINGPDPCAQKLAPYLTAHGVRVTAVANELAGQLEARSRVYDCVVVDLGPQARDRGVMVTRALRAEHRLPIVLIASGHDVGERIDVLDAGADDCVLASCSERELMSRILASIRRVRRLR
jgi:DNA-binding response OmpR family regulator